jgi:hypothetical protein
MARSRMVWGVAVMAGVMAARAMGGMPGDLAALKEFSSYKASSTDPTGGNNDFWWVEPGQSRVIFETAGPGSIMHIWMTTPSAKCSGSAFAGSLETTVIRMYWDGESSPSVDVPLGIFFCSPFDTGREFQSDAVVLTPLDGRGFNMYFPMPFAKSAKIELVNYNPEKRFRIYFGVDYVRYDKKSAVKGQGYFHARYRRQELKEGEDAVLLDAAGRGHYVGTVLAFDTGVRGDRAEYEKLGRKQKFYWWEGDERFTVDGQLSHQGTGTEDYFCCSWSYANERPYTTGQFGAAMNGYDPRDFGRWCLYRWHLSDPVAFKKNIRIALEHGPENKFTMVPYQTVAYWYQTEPHTAAELCMVKPEEISAPLLGKP